MLDSLSAEITQKFVNSLSYRLGFIIEGTKKIKTIHTNIPMIFSGQGSNTSKHTIAPITNSGPPINSTIPSKIFNL